MKTIGFIGLGLIGGSIAKAIRKYHPDYHILAYNRSKEALASAISTGIIDGVCEEMKDPRFGSCDYVFLCAPVEINLECLAYLKEIRQPGCIITDVGSVKGIIHQKVDELGMTDCFIPVYVLCVLTNLCIVCVSHLAVVKEVIDDYADQHFKGCRGTYSCCCDHVGAYIGIKTSCLKAILLRTFHHTGNQGKGSFRIVGSADLVTINYDLISVAFTCNVDHVGSIRCSCADGIQIDTSCDYLAAVVVNMVSDDFCSSRGSKEICMVMFVDSGKVVC